MKEYQTIHDEELSKHLSKNKELMKEMKEILESTTGFQAPPDKVLLKLLEIKKISMKMKTNDGV